MVTLADSGLMHQDDAENWRKPIAGRLWL